MPKRGKLREKTRCWFQAVVDGNISMVSQYIKDGWDINKKDESGQSALELAVKHNQCSIIKLLLESDTRRHGLSLLKMAIENKQVAAAMCLISYAESEHLQIPTTQSEKKIKFMDGGCIFIDLEIVKDFVLSEEKEEEKDDNRDIVVPYIVEVELAVKNNMLQVANRIRRQFLHSHPIPHAYLASLTCLFAILERITNTQTSEYDETMSVIVEVLQSVPLPSLRYLTIRHLVRTESITILKFLFLHISLDSEIHCYIIETSSPSFLSVLLQKYHHFLVPWNCLWTHGQDKRDLLIENAGGFDPLPFNQNSLVNDMIRHNCCVERLLHVLPTHLTLEDSSPIFKAENFLQVKDLFQRMRVYAPEWSCISNINNDKSIINKEYVNWLKETNMFVDDLKNFGGGPPDYQETKLFFFLKDYRFGIFNKLEKLFSYTPDVPSFEKGLDFMDQQLINHGQDTMHGHLSVFWIQERLHNFQITSNTKHMQVEKMLVFLKRKYLSRYLCCASFLPENIMEWSMKDPIEAPLLKHYHEKNRHFKISYLFRDFVDLFKHPILQEGWCFKDVDCQLLLTNTMKNINHEDPEDVQARIANVQYILQHQYLLQYKAQLMEQFHVSEDIFRNVWKGRRAVPELLRLLLRFQSIRRSTLRSLNLDIWFEQVMSDILDEEFVGWFERWEQVRKYLFQLFPIKGITVIVLEFTEMQDQLADSVTFYTMVRDELSIYQQHPIITTHMLSLVDYTDTCAKILDFTEKGRHRIDFSAYRHGYDIDLLP